MTALQCEDCDVYDPCMTSCPKKTCDNKAVYSSEFAGCDEHMCVEGCKTKPCPPGGCLTIDFSYFKTNVLIFYVMCYFNAKYNLLSWIYVRMDHISNL